MNEIEDVEQADKLQGAMVKARRLLQAEAMPCYYRMKTLILLGVVAPKDDEAYDCYIETECLYRGSRWFYRQCRDPVADGALQE